MATAETIFLQLGSELVIPGNKSWGALVTETPPEGIQFGQIVQTDGKPVTLTPEMRRFDHDGFKPLTEPFPRRSN